MAFWNYVIYHVSDFASIDFEGDIVTNASITPIYITVEDDDSRFHQSSSDTGQIQTISSSSDPSLVGQTIFSNVTQANRILEITDTGSLKFAEVMIGGPTDPFTSSDYIIVFSQDVSPILTPSTTYSEDTPGFTWTSWDHSGSSLPCFTAGTRILTPRGDVPIETLGLGDKVITADHGAERIRWIGQRTVTAAEKRADPRLAPIRIAAGAMGNGLPRRDLLVSRQHRMLVRSPVAARVYGFEEVLMPAAKLTGLPGIEVDQGDTDTTYVHILCRRHEVLFAERCPSESLYLGPRFCDATKEEAFRLFPGLKIDNFSFLTARLLADGPRAARLAERLRANRKKPLKPDPRRKTTA